MRIEVNGKKIAYIEVSPIYFSRFANLGDDMVSDETVKAATAFQRARVMAQSKAFGPDEKPVPFTVQDLVSLPVPVGRALVDATSAVLDTEGEASVVKDGDGVTSAIVVKLSRPIVFKSGDGKEEQQIEEIEFLAKTFGEVEDIYSETNGLLQALHLLKNVARPVLSSIKLNTLPAWAVDQISVNDGLFITKKVLPGFLK